MLHIVFGELIPKSMAIRSPLKTTLYIAAPLKAFRTLFLPLISFMNELANLFLKMMGMRTHEELVHSEEELKLIISRARRWGYRGQ